MIWVALAISVVLTAIRVGLLESRLAKGIGLTPKTTIAHYSCVRCGLSWVEDLGRGQF